MTGFQACDLSLTAAGNVKHLRKARHWSQADLAREAGVSRTLVAFLETGRRNFTLTVLGKVAAALGVSPAELIGVGTALRVDVYAPPGMSAGQVSDAIVSGINGYFPDLSISKRQAV